MNLNQINTTKRNSDRTLLSALGIIVLLALPMAENAVAVVDTQGPSPQASSISALRSNPNNPDQIKAKENKLKEVISGTIMRTGVVYPKHQPLPELDRIREFLRQGRPATTSAEIQELVKGLQAGDKDALENFEKHMGMYLANSSGTRAQQIIRALNGVIDSPNQFKLNQGYAQTLLDKAFDKFNTMDYNSKADLDFSRTNLDGKFIAGLDLRKTNLGSGQLQTFTDWANTDVSGLDLSGVNFTEKNTVGTVFEEANLSDSIWNNKDMSNNNLFKANLTGAKLIGANLSNNTTAERANFSGADLTGANGSGGTFRGANFSGAELGNANFSNSDLRGVNLNGANVPNTDFAGAVTGPAVDCDEV